MILNLVKAFLLTCFIITAGTGILWGIGTLASHLTADAVLTSLIVLGFGAVMLGCYQGIKK